MAVPLHHGGFPITGSTLPFHVAHRLVLYCATEVTSFVRPTQNVYHPRMAENENPEPKTKSSGWAGAGIVLVFCVTVIIIVQMITDYHW